MGAKSLLVVAGIAIATLIYLVYLGATYEPPETTTTVILAPPEPSSVEPEPVRPVQRPAAPPSAPTQTPAIDPEPLPEPAATPEPPVAEPTAPEVVPEPPLVLPSLNNSDGFIAERLRQLNNGVALLRHLSDEQLVRRFVVLVDNVARGSLPQANLPYRDVSGDFPVRSVDDDLFELDEAGFRRFDQVVGALEAVEVEQAVALYRIVEPLFQQAYAELGYGEERFDTALRRAIRRVLDTEEIDGPLQLVKPSVMYLYADTSIEAMSDIQKQLIRIGPENREKLKARLRQLLLAL